MTHFHTKVDFWAAASRQAVCAQCGRGGSEWDAHHVVEKGWLRRNKLPQWDPRNALRLCNVLDKGCHQQHTAAMQRVELSNLTDENIAYAFDAMGSAAYDYLKRRYASPDDERLEKWLAVTESREHFESIS